MTKGRQYRPLDVYMDDLKVRPDQDRADEMTRIADAARKIVLNHPDARTRRFAALAYVAATVNEAYSQLTEKVQIKLASERRSYDQTAECGLEMELQKRYSKE